jgi:mono/diheme cytochrome c family protein
VQFTSLSLAVVGLALAAQSARTQEAGDLQKGRVLAGQVCAECHAVREEDARSPNSNSPSFVAIASSPGMTATALNAFLHTSHRSMPNLILTTDQTNGIIAYVLSLKK